MRIGILTFHFGNNYGGILQCYALQRVLCEQGYSVEVIDYIPPQLPVYKRLLQKIKTINSVYALYDMLRISFPKTITPVVQDNASLKNRFNAFRQKYIRFSPSLNEHTIGAYANANYDTIIVGSDQIWTSLYASDAYFIGWKPDFSGKRISYAACSAHKFVRGKRRKELSDLLDKFTCITVRDETTAELIENITGTKPPIVPDPTELHDFREFLSGNDTQFQEPYILTYILGAEIAGGHRLALKNIKKQTGNIPVYSILSTSNSEIAGVSDNILSAVSPEDWIRLIAGAKAVYTDSFHAILFSMKFGIPFAGYWRDPVRSSRLINLRTCYSLENIVDTARDIKVVKSFKPKAADRGCNFSELLHGILKEKRAN